MQPLIYTDRDLTGVTFILSMKGVDRGETPNICSSSGASDYFDCTEEAYPLTQERKNCSCSSSYREAGLTHPQGHDWRYTAYCAESHKVLQSTSRTMGVALGWTEPKICSPT